MPNRDPYTLEELEKEVNRLFKDLDSTIKANAAAGEYVGYAAQELAKNEEYGASSHRKLPRRAENVGSIVEDLEQRYAVVQRIRNSLEQDMKVYQVGGRNLTGRAHQAYERGKQPLEKDHMRTTYLLGAIRNSLDRVPMPKAELDPETAYYSPGRLEDKVAYPDEREATPDWSRIIPAVNLGQYPLPLGQYSIPLKEYPIPMFDRSGSVPEGDLSEKVDRGNGYSGNTQTYRHRVQLPPYHYKMCQGGLSPQDNAGRYYDHK